MTGCWVGVALPGGIADLSGIAAFEVAIGRRLAVAATYKQWAYAADFDAPAARRLLARGTVPLLTWEPWYPRRGVDQPDYRLADIAGGRHDAYLRRWGEGIRDYGGPLLLRFAHEANGDWYPWCAGVYATTAEDYRAAFRHARDVVAANARWVWSPNVGYPGSTGLAALYPGDDVVDVVALDGYNAVERGGWRSFGRIFDADLAALSTLAPDKPVIIAETGCAEVGGDKAGWLRDLWPALRRRAAISGIVYFNIPGAGLDWRLTGARAVAAFAASADDGYFRATP